MEDEDPLVARSALVDDALSEEPVSDDDELFSEDAFSEEDELFSEDDFSEDDELLVEPERLSVL